MSKTAAWLRFRNLAFWTHAIYTNNILVKVQINRDMSSVYETGQIIFHFWSMDKWLDEHLDSDSHKVSLKCWIEKVKWETHTSELSGWSCSGKGWMLLFCEMKRTPGFYNFWSSWRILSIISSYKGSKVPNFAFVSIKFTELFRLADPFLRN